MDRRFRRRTLRAAADRLFDGRGTGRHRRQRRPHPRCRRQHGRRQPSRPGGALGNLVRFLPLGNGRSGRLRGPEKFPDRGEPRPRGHGDGGPPGRTEPGARPPDQPGGSGGHFHGQRHRRPARPRRQLREPPRFPWASLRREESPGSGRGSRSGGTSFHPELPPGAALNGRRNGAGRPLPSEHPYRPRPAGWQRYARRMVRRPSARSC